MKKIRIVLIAMILSLTYSSLFAQDAMFKALFIYNFTKYIEWPTSASGDFNITILGEPELFTELDKITGTKKVGSQNISVIKTNSLQNVQNSQIFYLSAGKSALLSEVIDLAKGKPILIVTDGPGLASKGAAINFVKIEGKQRFEINESVFNIHSLKLNAELKALGILIN